VTVNTAPLPVVVMLPVPNSITRTLAPVELNNPVERVRLLRFSVPLNNVKVLVVPKVNALPNVRVLPVELKVIELLINTPLVVIMLLIVSIVISPVALHVVVADRVMLPETVKVPVESIVQVAPVVVRDWQTNTPVNVIVGEPDAAFTITASAAVGTEAPPAPPEVADQFVVELVSQVPDPPTQYLSAI
jgi:hypothetical protein